MMASKKQALVAAGKEAAIEAVKEIPFVGTLIEGMRAYHDSIEEQQCTTLVEAIRLRLDLLEKNAEWFKSEEGQEFVKKVVATGLNAEYADKLEYLANALANGPTLGQQQAKRLKFVEMIRQLSKASLEVLAAAIANPTETGQVMPGNLATELGWDPSLVDSCVRELFAAGACRAFQAGTPRAKSGLANTSMKVLPRQLTLLASSLRSSHKEV